MATGMAGTWLVGAGNLGRALLDGWVAAGRDVSALTVIDPAQPALAGGVRAVTALPDGGDPPECVIVAVKPQSFLALAPALAARLSPETLAVSVMAGVRTERLADALGGAAVARVMPNLAMALRRGISVVHAPDARRRGEATALFADVGIVEQVGDEALFDAATALAGCGPAFLFRFVDALAKAGAAEGLPADMSARMAQAVAGGGAAMVAASGRTPAELAAAVASPNGVTAVGLAVLDADGALERLVGETLAAARRRSVELSGG